MTNTIKKRRELFVFYFAFLNNPNGDIDEENRPRQLPDGRIFTTDVFFKRRIRDYLEMNGEKIFYTKDPNKFKNNSSGVKGENALEKGKEFLDVRLFGFVPTDINATNLTGPVQVSYGISLFPTEILDVTITNAGKEGKEKIGKDPRIYRTILGYYIVVNDKLAEESGMTEEDYEKFREAVLEALKNNTTHTKIGFDFIGGIEIIHKEGSKKFIGNKLYKFLVDEEKDIDYVQELLKKLKEEFEKEDFIEEIKILK